MAVRRRRGATQATRGWRSVPSTGTAVSSGVWAMKPGRRRLLGEGVAEEAAEKRKGSVRAKVEHPVPVREAALRLRQGALPGRGEEQAAHRLAAGVLEPADRRALRDGMTREQSACRWRDDGEGGGSTRISPLLSLSHDKNSLQPVGNIVELQIQATSSPRSLRDGVVQTFLRGAVAVPPLSLRAAFRLPWPRFQAPAHQTGRADLPHPAFGRDHAFTLGRPMVCRVRQIRP